MPEVIGLGTTLKLGASTIGQVVSVQPPGGEVDDVEVTNLGHTDGIKRFIPGLIDEGELTFTVNLDETAHLTLLSAHRSRTSQAVEVTLPSGTKISFSGYVKGVEIQEIQPGEVIQAQLTVKAAGPVTVAAGS